MVDMLEDTLAETAFSKNLVTESTFFSHSSDHIFTIDLVFTNINIARIKVKVLAIRIF